LGKKPTGRTRPGKEEINKIIVRETKCKHVE
jgi:hypothetical protein